MENRFGVIGLGRFGTTIARTLAQRGAEVIVMDNDAHAIDALRDDVAYAVHMDATNIKLLREQSVQDLDAWLWPLGRILKGCC